MKSQDLINTAVKSFNIVTNDITKNGQSIHVINEKVVVAGEVKTETKSDQSAPQCATNDKCDLQTLTELCPIVAEELSKLGLVQHWLKFHKLVCSQRFPLDCFSFIS